MAACQAAKKLVWTRRIDEWCRVWIPIIYVTALFLIFNLSTDDDYSPDENGKIKQRKIFTGLPPTIGIEGGGAGWVRILCLPTIVFICTPIVYCARQLVSRPPSNHLNFCSLDQDMLARRSAARRVTHQKSWRYSHQ